MSCADFVSLFFLRNFSHPSCKSVFDVVGKRFGYVVSRLSLREVHLLIRTYSWVKKVPEIVVRTESPEIMVQSRTLGTEIRVGLLGPRSCWDRSPVGGLRLKSSGSRVRTGSSETLVR